MNKQTARLLEQHFDTAFAAPDGIVKLRELILTLAMQGRLVEQDPSDPPASELLKEIQAEKQRLVKAGKIKKPKPLPPIKPEEVPYELPKGWEWVRLPEVYFGIGNKQNQIQKKDYLERGLFPVIDQGKNFIAGYCNDNERIVKIDRPVVIFGDHTKKIKYVEFDFVIGAEGVKILCPYHAVFTKFLYFLIQSFDLTDRGYARHFKVLNEKLVPLPPFSEQQCIVARIDQLMARCDTLETLRKEREEKRFAIHAAAINQLLDAPDGSAWNFIQQHFGELYTVKENVAELRKAILQLAVMGRLVPQNPDDPPASELLKEIKAEKQRLLKAGKIKKSKPLPPIKPEDVPFELPQGWEWVRLSDLAQVITKGSSPNWQGVQYVNEGEGILFITSENVGSFELLLEKKKYVECKFNQIEPRSILKKRDILMNIVGASIGRTAIFDLDEVANINQAVTIIRLIETLVHEYFLNFFNSPICLNYMFDKQVENARPNLSMGNIALFAIPLPPLLEQHRIVAKIDQLTAMCDTLEQQIDAATDKQSEMLNAVMARVGG
jgi:type I restriction enzyme S subunit